MSKKDQDQGPAIDLGFQVDIAAELKAGFNGLRDGERTRRAEEESKIPFDFTVRGSGVAPGAGDLIFNCGGPPMGRAWVLRRLAVGGTDPTAVSAGVAYVYFSSAGDSDQLIAATWADVVSALPGVKFYTSRQMVVKDGQLIWVRITGPTAGAAYAVNGAVLSEIANERAAARYTL